ncbi:hypothetical protein CEUSTIGMA_g947.t1 [Chlamydomonas eustigma]|uniref:Starch synthase catalytic domain-containing protein n=1 Tax=Chlamydomonas eustigma TaxID=1157962 RepID=A0A250WRM9_9CHLO|nr:hypothetical protein CEUSTIGMA_g947.t1 [Chlamydomonas eustigma]|eukprot:GAX73495.1 hypothetical protein CEUSTIGMA_g947.t1 [Chlamydomonas eustigma]
MLNRGALSHQVYVSQDFSAHLHARLFGRADVGRRRSACVSVKAMRIVFVGTEITPWSKTGGLGDVMSALPAKLASRGHQVMTVSPLYRHHEDLYFTGVTAPVLLLGRCDAEKSDANVWNREAISWVKFYATEQDGVHHVFVDHALYSECSSATAMTYSDGHSITGVLSHEGDGGYLAELLTQVRASVLCQAALAAASLLLFRRRPGTTSQSTVHLSRKHPQGPRTEHRQGVMRARMVHCGRGASVDDAVGTGSDSLAAASRKLIQRHAVDPRLRQYLLPASLSSFGPGRPWPGFGCTHGLEGVQVPLSSSPVEQEVDQRFRDFTTWASACGEEDPGSSSDRVVFVGSDWASGLLPLWLDAYTDHSAPASPKLIGNHSGRQEMLRVSDCKPPDQPFGSSSSQDLGKLDTHSEAEHAASCLPEAEHAASCLPEDHVPTSESCHCNEPSTRLMGLQEKDEPSVTLTRLKEDVNGGCGSGPGRPAAWRQKRIHPTSSSPDKAADCVERGGGGMPRLACMGPVRRQKLRCSKSWQRHYRQGLSMSTTARIPQEVVSTTYNLQPTTSNKLLSSKERPIHDSLVQKKRLKPSSSSSKCDASVQHPVDRAPNLLTKRLLSQGLDIKGRVETGRRRTHVEKKRKKNPSTARLFNARLRRSLKLFRRFVATMLHDARFVLAIHNFGFHGLFPADTFSQLGLPPRHLPLLEHNTAPESIRSTTSAIQLADCSECQVSPEEASRSQVVASGGTRQISWLQAGLLTSDLLVTVSPQHALELRNLATEVLLGQDSGLDAARSTSSSDTAAGGPRPSAAMASALMQGPLTRWRKHCPHEADGSLLEAEDSLLEGYVQREEGPTLPSSAFGHQESGTAVHPYLGADGPGPAFNSSNGSSSSSCTTTEMDKSKLLQGIMNGVDTSIWDPRLDPFLPQSVRYGADNVSDGKAKAKRLLQTRLGLKQDASVPLFAFIGRLEDQKGADIFLAAVPTLLGPPKPTKPSSAAVGLRNAHLHAPQASQHGAPESSPVITESLQTGTLSLIPELPYFSTVNGKQGVASSLFDGQPPGDPVLLQLVMLGRGLPWQEEALNCLTQGYPGTAVGLPQYNEPLAHLLLAGADFLVAPSRYEPCGLVALCGVRYGTVPIVSPVGGLVDIVMGRVGKGTLAMSAERSPEVKQTQGKHRALSGTPAFKEPRQQDSTILGYMLSEPVGPSHDGAAVRRAVEVLVSSIYTATADFYLATSQVPQSRSNNQQECDKEVVSSAEGGCETGMWQQDTGSPERGSQPVTNSESTPVTTSGSIPVTTSGSQPVKTSGSQPVKTSGSIPVTNSGSQPLVKTSVQLFRAYRDIVGHHKSIRSEQPEAPSSNPNPKPKPGSPSSADADADAPSAAGTSASSFAGNRFLERRRRCMLADVSWEVAVEEWERALLSVSSTRSK